MKKMSRRDFVPLLGTALVGGALLSFTEKSSYLIEMPREFNPPPSLKPGDTVGICAPAGTIRRDSEVVDFQKIIHGMGFETKVGKNVKNKHGYLAGTDQERADDFMSMIKDENVKAIFFLRGGWGCSRLLTLLDFDAIKSNPKIIMGFSDITTLLNAITEKTKMITFHGPSGNSTWNDYSVNYIKQLLVEKLVFSYENQSGDSEIWTYSKGIAVGELIGGNLSVLTSLIGTDYLPSWKNKILFLEDVGEEPYSIDRMLMQLKLNGVFDQVKGIILGNFRKCFAEEPDRSFTLEEVFDQYFSSLDVPVFYGAQIGHTVNKITVPVGAQVRMDAGKGIISLLRPAVY